MIAVEKLSGLEYLIDFSITLLNPEDIKDDEKVVYSVYLTNENYEPLNSRDIMFNGIIDYVKTPDEISDGYIYKPSVISFSNIMTNKKYLVVKTDKRFDIELNIKFKR